MSIMAQLFVSCLKVELKSSVGGFGVKRDLAAK